MSTNPNIQEIHEIHELLIINDNNKTRKIKRKLDKDLQNLISKYDFMYSKYVIKNKPLKNLKYEKEKDIAIVQNSIKTFFPYILAYNIAQMSDPDEM
jgi:hypothetical protein